MKLGFLLGYSGKHIHMPIELIQQAEAAHKESKKAMELAEKKEAAPPPPVASPASPRGRARCWDECTARRTSPGRPHAAGLSHDVRLFQAPCERWRGERRRQSQCRRRRQPHRLQQTTLRRAVRRC